MCTGTAHAGGKPIVVVDYDAVYDAARSIVRFDLQFDRPPDFFTLDDHDRQRDAFQIWVDSAPGDGIHGSWERLIRGGEIWVDGLIPVRDDTEPADPTDPYSGGWGPVLDRLPYDLDGSVLSFETSFALLGTETGLFTYDLATAYFGSSSSYIVGAESRPIPAPGALSLVVLAGALWPRRRRA